MVDSTTGGLRDAMGKAKKPVPKNPMKRWMIQRGIVIGVIIILAIIVGIEWRNRSHTNFVTERLFAELQKTEQGNYRVRKSDLTAILGGREPNESYTVKTADDDERYDLYHFSGLFSKRTVVVRYHVHNDGKDEPDAIGILNHIPDEVQLTRKI